MYVQEHARIMQRSPHNSAVLDIGCGVGTFLSLFEHWEKFGYEPSEYASRQAAEKGISMVSHLCDLKDESMDLIVFRGTLQHINEPIAELAEATRILRKGGRLSILSTPDIDCLVYQIWHQLPALEARRNWILFGNHYLRNILSRLGYEEIEILHPYLGTPYAKPISDLCKFILSMFLGYRKFAFPGNMMEVHAVKR
jgi:ubiquinone/menaquinone biosynthesis C-methylase UbiE